MINHMLSTLIERVNGRQAYGKANDENEQKIKDKKKRKDIHFRNLIRDNSRNYLQFFLFFFNENKMNTNVHSPMIKQQ